MLSKFTPFKPSILTRAFSIWKNVPMGPVDPILGISEAYKKDPTPGKIDLSVGAYRDDNGKPWVLPSVKAADKILIENPYDYEYLPIIGLQSFITNSVKLALGENSQALKENRVAALQTLSGTGACRVGLDFCKRFLGGNPVVYVPNPTWPNHKNIANDAGLQCKEYRYWDSKKKGLNLSGLVEDLQAAPEGSIIMLHACAHNPTGVDPTESEWKAIQEVCTKKKHICFFDMAYQGYTSGDCDKDAKYVRQFADAGLPILCAQSFAKNFGLYGQRVGTLSLICANPEEKEKCMSQLKLVARPMYSNPPLNGARIIDTILKDPKLKAQWYAEIKQMSGRITSMRQKLADELKKLGNPHNWQHVVTQQGMFAYTGLNKDQCVELAEKHHIYLVMSGRISVAGLNNNNVAAVAKAFDAVTRNKSF